MFPVSNFNNDINQFQTEEMLRPLDPEGEKENVDDIGWDIPPPPKESKRGPAAFSSSTPLIPRLRRPFSANHQRSNIQVRSNFEAARLLFWGDDQDSSGLSNMSHFENESSHADSLPRPKGLAAFFFGFMYEDPFNDSIEYDEDETITNQTIWNPLNLALFVSYTLTSAAAVTPVLLIPTIGQELLVDGMENSAYASRAASFAVLGTACGKFLNGPVGDVFGARRTCVLYSFLLSVSLLALALSNDGTFAAWCWFYVEFFQSVQWPCILVILATHYSPHSHSMYEAGIYVTSIASRLGSLLGIPLFSFFLKQSSNWRLVCVSGAWIAMIGSSVGYLFLNDSPTKKNDPQNALHPNLVHQIKTANIRTTPRRCLRIALTVIYSILINNLLPSLKRVLKSGTFWVLALAHTGSSMVRTSDRVLGAYFYDTSMGEISESSAGGLVVYSILGTVLGLIIAGNMFTHRKERQRKGLVSRLYIITIIACYLMAFLAIPGVRNFIDTPDLVLFAQVLASFVMGFGIAVMYYQIPGLVGAAFGNNKGLFSAYTDGVAYGIASIVWRIVGNSVESGNQGGGWAYGWAAVALLIVITGILMIEFMEHYFVRKSGRLHGKYETLLFA